VGGSGSGNWYRWRKKDAVEDHRSIDVGYLNRNGMLRPGYWGTLSWWRDDEQVANIGVRAEEGRVVLDYRYRVRGSEEWQDVQYPVRLIWTPCNLGGERPWFVCPGVVNGRYCGRRVAKLYGASKYFLCRHCYDLTYRSRQEAPMMRHLHKAQKIRQRLGGSANMTEPFPERPKGMHHKTYWRLRWEHDEADWAYTLALAAWIGKLSDEIDQRFGSDQ
jgi:hypothetical protein